MMLRAAALVLLFVLTAFPAQAGCGETFFNGAKYTVCTFDPARERIETFNLDRDGAPLQSFTVLERSLRDEGKALLFAMNAGMFGTDYKPIGLYIEDGKLARKLNRRNGSGNFHLKPNGVFYVDKGRAGVLDTDAFAKSGLKPEFATQSGPMLVIDGKIHAKFSPTGVSEKIRNGVGVKDDGTVVFAISEDPVNFHAFALLFRDSYGCRNALFLDGSVSSLFSEELGRNSQFVPLGPMVGVVKMQ